MAVKFIESAQQRWRAVNAPHLVALVRAGADFERAFSSNVPKRPPHEPATGADGNFITRTRPGNRPYRPTRRGKEHGGTFARRSDVAQRPPALR